ncbi:hypothetical protein [Photobacterium sp. GB-27]|uniref:hypothetical protein n=1 Tax=Photobacterium sp. GB-27 TaxID=2022109 RepID=UPI001E33D873|nr:hypothetical protein [Photobacterium sp. GB-27]
MVKVSLISFLTSILLMGCAFTAEPVRISANGMIKWSDGRKEGMHVSSTGSTLTFANYSNAIGEGPIRIFARIDSARNDDCEYFYDETVIKRRLKICATGEVTLFNHGKVVKVGHIVKPSY